MKKCLKYYFFQSVVLYNLNAKFLCQYVAFFIACKPGWIGPNCIAMCPYPSYGHKCINVCECTKNECDVSEGCIKSRYLCFVKHQLISNIHFSIVSFHNICNVQMQFSLEQRIKDCLYKYMYQRSCTKLKQAPKWIIHRTNKTTITPSLTIHWTRHTSY